MNTTYSSSSFLATRGNSAFQNTHFSIEPYSGILLSVSAIACAALCLNYWENKNKEPVRARPIEETQTLNKIKKTYSYVFGGVTLTTLFAAAAHVSGFSLKILQNSSLSLPLFIGTVAAMRATSTISPQNSKAKHIAWTLFNLGMGMLFSPLGYLDRTLLMQAGAISLTLGGGLSLMAHLDHEEPLKHWQGPLLATLSSISLLSAIAYFFPKTAFAYGCDRLSLYGGLIIFSALFIADTQKIVEQAGQKDFDPVKASLDLYLDGANLFVKLVKLLLQIEEAKKQKKKTIQ